MDKYGIRNYKDGRIFKGYCSIRQKDVRRKKNGNYSSYVGKSV